MLVMDILEYTKFRHFSLSELQKSVFPKGSSVTNIDYFSLKKLDEARSFLQEPIYLNCSYRSVDWDKSKGRSGTSSHCKGCAFDIAVKDNEYRMHLVIALLHAGFHRIGIYKNFVHADDDFDKAPCMWYGEQ